MIDSEIYESVAKMMWSIMPRSAALFELFGKCYDDFLEDEVWFVDEFGKRFQFGFDDYPEDVLHEIMKKMCLLKEMEPFARQPWTHFRATLTDKGGFKLDFSHVPRERDVVGIFMQGGADAGLAK